MLNFEQNQNDHSTNENKNSNVMVPVTSASSTVGPQSVPSQQINTQVNTINQHQMPRIPAMYFPNNNVTINYNFAK